MITSFRRRVNLMVGAGRNRFFNDDFNWETYTRDKYGPQIEMLEGQFNLHVDPSARFDAETQKLLTPNCHLHPNSHTLYETVGKLAVNSTIEVGCGGGDHLRNLKQLYPSMSVRGGDRSEGQLAFLRDRNPDIADDVFVQDITMPLSTKWPRAQLVYSQAVIMHIKTAVSHLVALSNMFHLADDYVVLMENYGCHPFVDDIRMLHEGGQIPWDQVHFHVACFEDQPYCLVASRHPCVLPVLENYDDLPLATKKRY